MTSQELMACINGGSIICATATEFLKSRITWNEDNINPEDYIVELLRPNDIDNVMVTFVKEDEWRNKVYNTDFSETIKTEDEEEFLKELCECSEIFFEKSPQIYTTKNY